MQTLPRTSWFLLAAATLLLLGVGLFGWLVADRQSAQRDALERSRSSFAQKAAVSRVHSLAQETADDRRKLSLVLGSDVVSIADMIDGVGRAAGAAITLSNVTQGSALPGADSVHTANFSIEATGSFTNIMRAVHLLETLPIPSTVQNVNIERTGASASSAWHLNADIRIFTTAISS